MDNKDSQECCGHGCGCHQPDYDEEALADVANPFRDEEAQNARNAKFLVKFFGGVILVIIGLCFLIKFYGTR